MEEDISVSMPPMTPAIATARLESAITSHGGVEFPFLAVQRLKRLIEFRPSHDDFPSLQCVRIEGVKRMPQLHQDVVRDVGNIVDRPDSHRLEFPNHPVGRGPDMGALDITAAIAAAEIGVRDGDREGLVGRTIDFLDLELRPTHLDVERGAGLARDSEVRQAIPAV